MIKTIILFVLAGVAEIGGGYLIWLWLRADNLFGMGLLAVLSLFFMASSQHYKATHRSDESTPPMVEFS